MVYSFPDAYWMLIKISSLALIVGVRIDGIELVASYQLHLFEIYQWESLCKNLNTIALTRSHFFLQQKKNGHRNRMHNASGPNCAKNSCCNQEYVHLIY